MKKTIFLTLFAGLFSISLFSQTSFTKTQSIALPLPGGNAPYNIKSGLIDNDNFPDLVVSTTLGNSVFWLKNDGMGNFILQLPAFATLNNAGGVAIGDINGDGFNDVVTTSYNDDKLVWFANDGLGNFGSEQMISSDLSGPSQVYIRNIDADGTLDVSVSSYTGNEVVWFANNGSGVFGPKNIVNNTILSPGAYAMDDIDGDGDIDSVIANAVAYGTPNDCRIEVFYNDGSGVFTADTNPVAVNTKDYIFSVMAEDIDGDNSRDILVTDITGSPSYFKRTEITPGTASYVETILSTSIANPACLDLQDLDNDGFPDFVLTSATSGGGNDIVWYKNNGSGGFDSEVVIDATQRQAYTIAFEDFENDGDLDIATIAYADDKVNVFNNQLIVLGMEDNNSDTISIFPNPTTDELYFKGITNSMTISVFDALGKIMVNKTLEMNQSLDVSSFAAGIYIIKFENSKRSFKFVKE
ncbi:MAG: T9SS type A sorting domain-containing protein [Aquaticitalea sp.]